MMNRKLKNFDAESCLNALLEGVGENLILFDLKKSYKSGMCFFNESTGRCPMHKANIKIS